MTAMAHFAPRTGRSVADALRAARGADRWRLAVGSALGLGLIPVAPGSFAALAGVLADAAVSVALPAGWHRPTLALLLAAVTAAHVALTPWAVRFWRDEDPGHFVLDEVAGYLAVAVLFREGPLAARLAVGFLLFRVLDIVKIPPARQIDREMHGPWGIVLDDLVSGAYAALVMVALWRWVPGLAG